MSRLHKSWWEYDHPKRLPDAVYAGVCAEYLDGFELSYITSGYHLSGHKQVYEILRRFGIPTNRPRGRRRRELSS